MPEIPSSDPLERFSYGKTSPAPSNGAPSSLTSLGSPEREAKSASRKLVPYVEVVRLTPAQRSQYKSVEERLDEDADSYEPQPVQILGEYKDDSTLWYFATHDDGIAHKYEAKDFTSKFPDLVDAYKRKKNKGKLAPFDPSATYVHPSSRIRIALNFAQLKRQAKSRKKSVESDGDEQWENQTSEDEEEQEVEDFIDDDTPQPPRRNTRAAANKAAKSSRALPFSPKRTRGHGRKAVSLSDESEAEAESPAEQAAGTRRSTRARKAVQRGGADDEGYEESGSDDDSDEYQQSGRKKAKSGLTVKRRAKTSNPAYGHIRSIEDFEYHPRDVDDPYTKPLRAHRGICEKCHWQPAHILLAKEQKRGRKGKGRKKKVDEDDDDEEEDEMQKLESLGGWVRWYVNLAEPHHNSHWHCLASTQRSEILKAAQERDRAEWMEDKAKNGEDEDEPMEISGPNGNKVGPQKRPGLTPYQTTEFICAACVKGGTCMGCLETALEPETVTSRPTPAPAEIPSHPLDTDVQMLDENAASTSGKTLDSAPAPASAIPDELVFRCITCKRIAHYAHLPAEDDMQDDDGEVDKVAVARRYQTVNQWNCADCFSYVYRLDKILAWRPFPSTAVEPPLPPGEAPNYKANLPREYLVKWEDRSYRRTQWVPHGWLSAKSPQKLRHFLMHGSSVELLSEAVKDEEVANEVAEGGVGKDVEESRDSSLKPDEPLRETGYSLDPIPDAERRIPPAWKTVDRVLDVLLWTPKLKKKPAKGGKLGNKKIVESDSEAEAEWEATFEHGEEPRTEYTTPLDDWLREKEADLEESDIDKVVWAFMKWDELGYDEATWDSPPRKGEPGYSAFEAAFERLVASQHVNITKRSKSEYRVFDERRKGGYRSKALDRDEQEQPKLGQSDQLKLMDFQIDGYNWLCGNWWDHQPCILADEMGLGKTVQIATFVGTIVDRWKAAPILVVVPNSTITNWVREFARWAPKLRVVPFYGEAKAREIIKRYELTHSRPVVGTTDTKFHVLVTTYDNLSNAKDSASVFKRVQRWEALIVDEGQRLKNDNSLLFKKLNELSIVHRIIMTGTPLNNNIRELFNLMNFLDPNEWNDLEALEKEHEELTEELVKQLHNRLRPYFLRRVKAEVLKLPHKNEVIVPVSLTPLQKEIYKSILSKNVSLLMSLTQSLAKSKVSLKRTNLNNILMELRKCIQHPYIVSHEIEPKGLSIADAHEKLIAASAKFRLLKILLPKLRARGHRVLLFSQFVIALNVIEDFLIGEGVKYLRLDGNTKQVDRQKGMDEFNRPDSDVFIYLLTTRAGGVGINLWSADTVIIFDPDYNPHQAIARAHRYGQTKPCLVFKLMAKDTAEERIMQAGKKKLILDHVIVQKMDEEAGEDVQSILTYGAKALFEEGESARDINYTDNDVDNLIEKTEREGDGQDAAAESGMTFSFAKVWAAEKDNLEEMADDKPEAADQVDSWAQTLQRIAAQRAMVETAEATGRGVRRKAAAWASKPQQSIFLEDTPTKPKPKGASKAPRRSQSRASDDSEFNVDASSLSSVDDDSDSGVPESVPGVPRDKGKSKEPGPSAVPQLLAPQVPTKTTPDENECSLCQSVHEGPCIMTENSENMAEYRRVLLYDNTEPVEERRAAIRIIDEVLNRRGKSYLIADQPLRLVDPAVPAPPPIPTKKPEVRHDAVSARNAHSSEPRKSNQSLKPTNGASHGSSRKQQLATIRPAVPQPVAGPSSVPISNTSSTALKRPATSAENGEPKRKKNKMDTSICAVCGRSPLHLIKDCPIVAEGPKSISKAIARLDQIPEQDMVVRTLQKLLKKQKKKLLLSADGEKH
ncbi:hypothetical protein EVG20_g3685 [Dentipellis fragilis]|uniref:Chromatin remodeling factor mit1 n=1 Tax=Dentipellis fragilis TaxID=205917 RepID=A0A4Y9Z2J7_9AGAM|nr:hypothetical protein EVG20_g3685 [Dentipellis fragilis]